MITPEVDSLLIAAFSAFLAAMLVYLFLRPREAALEERIRARETENARLTAEITTLRAESAQLAASNAEARTQLSAERTAHERVINEFKALSADALRSNRSDFLEQAKQAFAQLHQQSAGD